MILHIDLDTFFVSVERLLNPDLVGKPVICGHKGERSVVSTASYEVRKFGVHSGMPMVQALRLCPQAIVVYSGHGVYGEYSRMVQQIVYESAPLYQQMSCDEYFIDLSGMDRFFDVPKWAHDLRMRIISETKLPISYGLSINRTVAKIASGQAKPMGELYIPEDKVQEFLDPLPVKKIPGVGDSILPRLHRLGISTIGDLRRYPRTLFISEFGRSADVLWLKANGIDHNPVVPNTDHKSLSTETTFEYDVSDTQRLVDTILIMADTLAYRLRAQRKKCTTVAIKIKYPDFKTEERQKTISPTDYTETIAAMAKTLFDTLYKGQPVRLIGVRLNISAQNTMNDLFSYNPKRDTLNHTIDGLKDRFGSDVIKSGNSF
ncbi:MAG: DNA polymerase IV [Bacteroidales bacterium]|nr:DNA polymerase IV [Bacteroidales bacterium]